MAWDISEIIKSMDRFLLAHEIVELEHIRPFTQQLMDSPDQAIARISQVYNEALNQSYKDTGHERDRAFLESIAGGPYERIPWAIYNAVGSIYPYCTREQRDKALGQLLCIWDGINSGYVNGARSTGHTTGIREPLLQADIEIVREIYWPGLRDQDHMIAKYNSFAELQRGLMDETGLFDPRQVNSDFLTAYRLLRSDLYPESEAYARAAHPQFLERTVQAIVNMRFGRATTEEQIVKGRARLQELLPSFLHGKIDEYRERAEWVDYKKFP